MENMIKKIVDADNEAKAMEKVNLEEKELSGKYSEKEIKAKEHLENTTDITTNMGYGHIQGEFGKTKEKENERQKE